MDYTGLITPDPSLGEVCISIDGYIGGTPAVYAPADGGPPHIYIQGVNNNLLEFIPDNAGGRLWNAYDRTNDTGAQVSGRPAVYAPDGGPPHIYIQGFNNNLLEFIPDGRP